LDLAKIEKGKLSMGRSLVNIGNIALDVMKSLSIQAQKNNIELVSDIDTASLPNIYASPDQIAEVFTNLIDNAIKYNKKGGRVTVCVKIVEGAIESTVEDTGIGIAPGNIGKLFEKFKRLQNDDIETRKKGTGLGLVIAKEIIQMHGGKISVESVFGTGTKFKFVLPGGLRKRDQDLLKNEEQKDTSDRG
ncbi:MAG: HAMP domain-containing sensor histidine kinase, partial [Candidatus Omnitrophica bacterium]|nr:HAMP domain-containing sensor histidine kinase [Candidatus Omnitrophota bacterium]